MRVNDDYEDSDEQTESMEVCSECSGTGISDCPMEYGNMRHPHDCPACGGEQKTMCTYCEGTGRVPA